MSNTKKLSYTKSKQKMKGKQNQFLFTETKKSRKICSNQENIFLQ